MDCDRVFGILTRGPFPTGHSSDGAVESHILRCPGCRRLAEALRPADDVEQESVTTEESLALPAYWSDLNGASRQLAVSVGKPKRLAAPQPKIAPQPQLQSRPHSLTSIMAAVVALSLLLAAIGRAVIAVMFLR